MMIGLKVKARQDAEQAGKAPKTGCKTEKSSTPRQKPADQPRIKGLSAFSNRGASERIRFFRVLSGRWCHVEFSAVEVNGRREVLKVAESPCRVPDPLDLRIQAFARRVREPVFEVSQQMGQSRLQHFCAFRSSVSTSRLCVAHRYPPREMSLGLACQCGDSQNCMPCSFSAQARAVLSLLSRNSRNSAQATRPKDCSGCRSQSVLSAH